MTPLNQVQKGLLATIRDFVNKEVIPVAPALERADEYPSELVEKFKELGLFGATIPEKYGGLGLNTKTYALIIEEICRGWMSLSGIINAHLIMAYVVEKHGTDDQKNHYLPLFATGEKRGGICITEPDAGSDVQSIKTWAQFENGKYVVNGSKMFITNSLHGNTFALVAKTDRNAHPPHKGISLFIAEKGPGFNVVREIQKLGYKGIDTCELSFENYEVPAENIVGSKEGLGFYHIMSGLELGRINVAARAVGVARACLQDAMLYAKTRRSFGKPISEHQAIQLKIADMSTKIQAAHLLVMSAAEKFDRGERADLEAGMAKLFASEICLDVSVEAMRIHGGYGYTTDLPIERHFRDAPLMIIGEGTNEIQRLVIAKNLLKNCPSGDFIYEANLQ